MTANELNEIYSYFSEVSKMKAYLREAKGLRSLKIIDSLGRELYLTPVDPSGGLHEKIRRIFQEEIEDIKKVLLEKYNVTYEDASK